MRRYVVALAFVMAACGGSSTADKPASSTSAPTASLADARTRCANFSAADAAPFLGVDAGVVTAHAEDVTPATRGCTYSTGSKAVSFSLTLESSIDEAKRNFENLRENYTIAARAQEAAGVKLEKGAYSDIMGVGDDAIWSDTNTSLAVRHGNMTILVMQPNDKKVQVAVAEKILERLKG